MVNKACAGLKSERFQSMTELREALEDALRHWEAVQITQKAEQLLQQFTLSLDDSDVENIEVSKQYLKIRTLLESSIEIWSGNQIAIDALSQLLILMIRYHLQRWDVGRGLSLLNSLHRRKI